jgi:uncharacterized protein (TIGR03083 family)
MNIRPATPADLPAVLAVQAAAFGDDVVPRLVQRLVATPGAFGFVALGDDGSVVGHVLVSPVPLETAPGELSAIACLSPLGVHPSSQGRGHARALVEAALAEAARRGEPVVVLEGDPAHYHRYGFVPAAEHRLRRPSERIPQPAFQAWPTPGGHVPSGRVLYPDVFWELDAIGLPVEGPTWLDEFERQCRAIEAAAPAALNAPVPTCPGWDVAALLDHCGVVQRLVRSWLVDGRRPRATPTPDGDSVAWFASGWRALHELLDELEPQTLTATWCPWDSTAGFWRRRMAHEHAIHALDVALATGTGWTVRDDVALDGCDEALRLWLGTRLGSDVRGGGEVVRVVAGERRWTVGLDPRHVEVHDAPTLPDATVTAAPAELYAWLWRRGEAGVRVDGDTAAVAVLREALGRATR